jgi:hypothetical protein
LWIKKNKKTIRKKKERQKVNLIFSHVNHVFLILDPWIGPQTFIHTNCTPYKNDGVKKGPIQGPMCFKLMHGLSVLESLSKVVLSFTPQPLHDPFVFVQRLKVVPWVLNFASTYSKFNLDSPWWGGGGTLLEYEFS